MSLLRTTWMLGQELHQEVWTQAIQHKSQQLVTNKETCPLGDQSPDQGIRDPTGTGQVAKRQMSPVRDALRARLEPKSIMMKNYYPALNCMENLENDNDHLMVKIQLNSETE